MSSKEIARELGISPHTVDQRLKRATALLDLSTRFEAARLFVRYEQMVGNSPFSSDPVYDHLVYQSPDMSISADSATSISSPGTQSRPGDGDGDELHEYQQAYFATAMPVPTQPPFWTALVEAGIGRGQDNTLSIPARVAVMVLIGIGAVMSFAALVSVAEGLSRLS